MASFPNVRCPHCHEENVSIHINLAEYHCHECEETYDLDEIRDLIEGWAAVLKWIDAAPQFGAVEDEPPTTLEQSA